MISSLAQGSRCVPERAPHQSSRTRLDPDMVAEHGCAQESGDLKGGGSRRAARRIFARVEQDVKTQADEVQAIFAKEFFAQVDAYLQKIFGPRSIGQRGRVEGVVLQDEGRLLRYFAEIATGDAESEATEDALAAHAEATKVTEKVLVVTHPIGRSLALNSSVVWYEVLQDPDEACQERIVEEIVGVYVPLMDEITGVV